MNQPSLYGNPASPWRGISSFLLSALFLSCWLICACGETRVKKDLTLGRDFRPQETQNLAVVNLDPQVQFSHFVEAELLKKGYRVKESSTVAQFLKSESLIKEGSLEPSSLARIGNQLQVQGVVLCSILEFSRFRDSYRLSIRCVAPQTGNTLWYAEGRKEGRKGQKSIDLVKEIVVSALKGIPSVP
ncbi:MAG: hypothetical protein H6Q44_756 [Deltaproteobacteria bacterium]|nr:hypothetical protein [Deltaproteobacteria bacterium]